MDLPPNVKLEIQATLYAFTAASSDKLAWAENLRGVSDLKSAHDLATVTSTFHSRENGSGKFKLCPKSNSFSGSAFTIALE